MIVLIKVICGLLQKYLFLIKECRFLCYFVKFVIKAYLQF